MGKPEFTTEVFRSGHVQGIAWDAEKEEMYFAFTTLLVKTDKTGRTLATVGNLAGHLGCIAFDEERRQVVGSLEMKHDAIGQGVIRSIGYDPCRDDLFYAVAFDCDRIDRIGMDAANDGVMRAVLLPEVCADFAATDPVSGRRHRYGCSGIDGTAVGPAPGEEEGEKKLLIAYGIYSEPDRADNDLQVILQYPTDLFDRFGKTLFPSDPHRSAAECEKKYFFYTGNTEWGVQNLEYDAHSHRYLFAVYRGRKPAFQNPPLFFADATKKPVLTALPGRGGERGLLLLPASPSSSRFPLGQTGMIACGDGTFFFAEALRDCGDLARISVWSDAGGGNFVRME